MKISFALVFLLFFSKYTSSQDFTDSLVTCEIIAEKDFISSNDTVLIAVKMSIKDDWHIYWKNPGDNGLPTSFSWDLPEGFVIKDEAFPYPKRFFSEGLVNFGYSNNVYFLFTLISSNLNSSQQKINLVCNIDWLSCRDVCIPGNALLTKELSLSSKKEKIDKNVNLFNDIKLKLPINNCKIDISAKLIGKEIEFNISEKSLNNPIKHLDFFPLEQGIVLYSRIPEIRYSGGIYSFSIPLDPLCTEIPKTIEFLLYNQDGFENQKQIKAIQKLITINK